MTTGNFYYLKDSYYEKLYNDRMQRYDNHFDDTLILTTSNSLFYLSKRS